jgi:hypothetical protein
LDARLGIDRKGASGYFENADDADWSREEAAREKQGDFESYKAIAEGSVGWSMSNLPEGAELLGWDGFIGILAASRGAFAMLEGHEQGAAGLEGFRMALGWDRIGRAASFCLDGTTYTVFEKPLERGGKLAEIVAREGNLCARKFDPVPLEACALVDGYDDDGWSIHEKVDFRDERAAGGKYLEFFEPQTGERVMALGHRWNEWDRQDVFEDWLYEKGLERAMASELSAGAALARDLRASLPRSGDEPGIKRKAARL